MARFFTLAVAAALAAGMVTNAWSQGGQSGAGSGSAGASGSAGTSGSSASGGASADANAQGTAGTTAAGQGGTTNAGQGGTTTAGQAGTTAPGRAGSQIGTGRQNPSNVPGQRQFGQTPTPGANFDGFNGIPQTPFFSDPGVRRQLNMNDQQFNALNRAHQDALTRFNLGRSNLGDNLTPQQRMAQMQQLEARFNQEFGQTLDSTFTDPQARQRFNQLNSQFDTFRTFNDPTVRQQLNLAPQQQRQLRRLQNAWRQRMQQLRRAGNENAQLTDEQWAQLQAQNMQQINAVLTPQQRQVWTQLVGEPFTFPRSVFFPDTDRQNPGVPPVVGEQPPRGGRFAPAGPTNDNRVQQSRRNNNVQTGQQQGTQAPARR